MRDTFFCLQSLQSILEKTQDTVVELFGLTGTQGFHLLLNGRLNFGGKHPIAFRPYRLSPAFSLLVDNFYPFGRLPTFIFEIHFLTCLGYTQCTTLYRVHRKLYAFEGLKAMTNLRNEKSHSLPTRSRLEVKQTCGLAKKFLMKKKAR